MLNNAVSNTKLTGIVDTKLKHNAISMKAKENILNLLLNWQRHLRIQNLNDSIVNLYVDSFFYAQFRMTRETFYKLVVLCNKNR